VNEPVAASDEPRQHYITYGGDRCYVADDPAYIAGMELRESAKKKAGLDAEDDSELVDRGSPGIRRWLAYQDRKGEKA
jgi:hypothetical protein